MSSDFESLVNDALRDTPRTPRDSCFVVNEAGMELFRSSESVLPVIEKVLLEIVIPEVINHPAISFNELGFDNGDVLFPGLNHVLGAYLLIGSQYDPERVFTFLAECIEDLKAEALLAIPIVFNSSPREELVGIRPTAELIEFIHIQNKSQNERVRRAAAFACSRLKLKLAQWPCES